MSFNDSDALDLKRLFATILKNWLLILIAGSLAFCFGMFLSWNTTPKYLVDASIHVEKRLGALPMLDASSYYSDIRGQAQTEVEILRSRSVIRRVVEEMQLDVQIQPKYFPVVGKSLARNGNYASEPGESSFMQPYAWGGEVLEIGRIDLPQALLGTHFTLTAESDQQFSLQSPALPQKASGVVGEVLEIETDAGKLSLFVRKLVAAPGSEFGVIKHRPGVIDRVLQNRLLVSERGNYTGIVSVELMGEDPKRITNIVNALLNSYVRQDSERRSEEARRMLAFLDSQLPQLKEAVDLAELKLKEFQAKRGSSVDISVEGADYLHRTAEILRRTSQLELQRSEMLTRFTKEHPSYKALEQKIAQLRRTRSDLERKQQSLPKQELESIRLVRNVEVANDLYIELLNRAQELKVAKAGAIGDARVLDFAEIPVSPVRPDKKLNMILSFLLAILAAGLAVFVRYLIKHTVDSPDDIERQLAVPVLAVVPNSRAEIKVSKKARAKANNGLQLLAKTNPGDNEEEGIRSLRTSLQFSCLDAKNNIICIHGPTPGVGKSFIAANLAYTFSKLGKKVLLIDADLRKGYLHGALGVSNKPGLSEVITQQAPLEEALRKVDGNELCFIPSGAVPSNPSELLGHNRFAELLRTAAENFDHVILDTPPTLNLSDSISVGALSGTNIIVARAGKNTLDDIDISRKRLEQNGITLNGVVFNSMTRKMAKYRYRGNYSSKAVGSS